MSNRTERFSSKFYPRDGGRRMSTSHGTGTAKVRPVNDDFEAETAAQDRCQTLTKEARELSTQAQAIEDAAYDLKAVNPNAKPDQETRTPAELLDFIAAKGQEITAALEKLRI